MFLNQCTCGIQALTHIFKLILIKTNDINNAIDVTQRCFFYYIEFVMQISVLMIIYNYHSMMQLYFYIKNQYFNIMIKNL